MSQLRTIEIETPEDWITRAKAENNPIRTVCLFSGGSDSLVLAHRCHEHYDELVHIDTGTAVPGVLDHVKRSAEELDKPLCILSYDFDPLRLLVLGGTDPNGHEWHPLGFPGPGQHNRAYSRLKERHLRLYLKEVKQGHPHNARVLGLSGIRQDESARRQNRKPLTREGSFAFCNPLIEWSNAEMQDYRDRHDLQLSDVAAILHRSGECQCGCYADENEREMLKSLWPKWFEEKIGSLEREAEKQGLECPRWGGNRSEAAVAGGPMCSTCEVMIEGQQEMDLDEAETDQSDQSKGSK